MIEFTEREKQLVEENARYKDACIWSLAQLSKACNLLGGLKIDESKIDDAVTLIHSAKDLLRNATRKGTK